MKQIVNKALVALSITIVGICLVPYSKPFDYDYDEEKETLRVESPDSRVYEYHDVPKTIYEELEKSPQPVQYDLKAQKDQIKAQKDQIKKLEDELKVAKRKALVRGCGGQDKVDFNQKYASVIYLVARADSPRMEHSQAEAFTKSFLKKRPKSEGVCREAIDHLIDWMAIQRTWDDYKRRNEDYKRRNEMELFQFPN